MKSKPVVLVFAGHDPSGGAGIQADIESLTRQGCHAATVITSLTVQDTRDVIDILPVDPAQVITQARAILEDMPVAAFKLGLLGTVELIEVIHTILTDYPEIPVILDPVLATGRGTDLGEAGVVEALRVLLLPMTGILTPNSLEARALTPGADTLSASALALLDQGVDYALITGSHENTPQVVNRLYHDQRQLESFTWERLPHQYHGSGCTLAASIAAHVAQGQEPVEAIRRAQAFTWKALRAGYRPGLGQYLPDRGFEDSTD
jgi:hydroxymethylpyrimidine/phosphomethylpyrimidine kinase